MEGGAVDGIEAVRVECSGNIEKVRLAQGIRGLERTVGQVGWRINTNDEGVIKDGLLEKAVILLPILNL